MSEHKWQPGDRCETNSGKPCRIAGYLNNGELVWEYECAPGRWVLVWTSICREKAGIAPKPPTRKVVQWHAYIGDSVGWVSHDTGKKLAHAATVEWELCGYKIVGVRLVEGGE